MTVWADEDELDEVGGYGWYLSRVEPFQSDNDSDSDVDESGLWKDCDMKVAVRLYLSGWFDKQAFFLVSKSRVSGTSEIVELVASEGLFQAAYYCGDGPAERVKRGKRVANSLRWDGRGDELLYVKSNAALCMRRFLDHAVASSKTRESRELGAAMPAFGSVLLPDLRKAV